MSPLSDQNSQRQTNIDSKDRAKIWRSNIDARSDGFWVIMKIKCVLFCSRIISISTYFSVHLSVLSSKS